MATLLQCCYSENLFSCMLFSAIRTCAKNSITIFSEYALPSELSDYDGVQFFKDEDSIGQNPSLRYAYAAADEAIRVGHDLEHWTAEARDAKMRSHSGVSNIKEQNSASTDESDDELKRAIQASLEDLGLNGGRFPIPSPSLPRGLKGRRPVLNEPYPDPRDTELHLPPTAWLSFDSTSTVPPQGKHKYIDLSQATDDENDLHSHYDKWKTSAIRKRRKSVESIPDSEDGAAMYRPKKRNGSTASPKSSKADLSISADDIDEQNL